VRFRELKEQDLERARAAVKEWREKHPQGQAQQLIAEIGGQFHPDYGPVLRGILFATDSHDAKITTGVFFVEVR
jgi:hypothetical protein